jgi:hypothetical protein
MKTLNMFGLSLAVFATSTVALAAPPADGAAVPESRAARDHGPGSSGFSHKFQWAPRSYEGGQLGVHFGLSQPLLLGGFNVAADLHWKRWVLEYSHGMNLDYNRIESVKLTSAERSAGLDLDSPWTTGFGVGFRVVDELYPMLEGKAHRYTASQGGETQRYTTVSVGPAIAHRLFVYDGFFVNSYLRYWPNVWSSQNKVDFASGLSHDPLDLGFFANISIGYAIDLSSASKSKSAARTGGQRF